MSRIAAIVPAAGLGTRMGAETPKQFLELDGMPLMIFTLRRLAACAAITDFFISTRADDVVSLQDKVAKAAIGAAGARGAWRRHAAAIGGERAGAGGSRRPKSCWCTMRCGRSSRREQLDRVIAEARARGAAILGIPAIDTVKEVKRASLPEDVALITATIPRERIVLAQTPQAFSYDAAARCVSRGAERMA